MLDGGGGKHSVFAKAFIGALRENDAVLDGQSLFDRVKRPVVLNANQTPRYADIRNSGHDGGDFLFVKTRGITVTPKAPAQTASPPASTGPSNAAEILFWQSIQDSDSPAMFSAYLDQYPRGTFAQLARLKIEQLSKPAQIQPKRPPKDRKIVSAARSAPSASTTPRKAGLEGIWTAKNDGWEIKLVVQAGKVVANLSCASSGEQRQESGSLRKGGRVSLIFSYGHYSVELTGALPLLKTSYQVVDDESGVAPQCPAATLKLARR